TDALIYFSAFGTVGTDRPSSDWFPKGAPVAVEGRARAPPQSRDSRGSRTSVGSRQATTWVVDFPFLMHNMRNRHTLLIFHKETAESILFRGKLATTPDSTCGRWTISNGSG